MDSWGVYLEPGQRWVSSLDADDVITVEAPTDMRWKVRTDHGEMHEMTAWQIRERYALIPS
jgi:hypothetical protein